MKYITLLWRHTVEQNARDIKISQRCGPYIGGNLPKVRSWHCPHGILPRPYKVYIYNPVTVCPILIIYQWAWHLETLINPILNPHWPTCKYGPDLWPVGSSQSWTVGEFALAVLIKTLKILININCTLNWVDL